MTKSDKIFWGVLLLITAVALIFYGMGYGTELFGLPIYKLLLAIVLITKILSKLIRLDTTRLFFCIGLLFMLLETEISGWMGLADENIISNWIVLVAAIIADIAIGMIFPKSKKDGMHFKRKDGDIHIGNGGGFDSSETFENATHYIDASKHTYSCFKNKMGNIHIYYQNTDLVEPGSEFHLELYNKMANMIIHVPHDWNVTNNIETKMGNTDIRSNFGNKVKLTLTGENKMGNIRVLD